MIRPTKLPKVDVSFRDDAEVIAFEVSVPGTQELQSVPGREACQSDLTFDTLAFL